MNKSSPGPWYVEHGVVWSAHDLAIMSNIATLKGNTWPVSDSDMRLIAAAPELYLALKAIVSGILLGNCEYEIAIKAAIEALEKAEGVMP